MIKVKANKLKPLINILVWNMTIMEMFPFYSYAFKMRIQKCRTYPSKNNVSFTILT